MTILKLLLGVAWLACCGAVPINGTEYVKDLDLSFEKVAVCVTDDLKYVEGDVIPGAGPCEECLCKNSKIVCSMIKCEVKAGCKIIEKQNQCCPDYKCECELNGSVYNNGEKVDMSNAPCKVCYCKGGDITCTNIECYTRDDCQGKIVPGICCPKYDHCPLFYDPELRLNYTNTTKPANTFSMRPLGRELKEEMENTNISIDFTKNSTATIQLEPNATLFHTEIPPISNSPVSSQQTTIEHTTQNSTIFEMTTMQVNFHPPIPEPSKISKEIIIGIRHRCQETAVAREIPVYVDYKLYENLTSAEIPKLVTLLTKHKTYEELSETFEEEEDSDVLFMPKRKLTAILTPLNLSRQYLLSLNDVPIIKYDDLVRGLPREVDYLEKVQEGSDLLLGIREKCAPPCEQDQVFANFSERAGVCKQIGNIENATFEMPQNAEAFEKKVANFSIKANSTENSTNASQIENFDNVNFTSEIPVLNPHDVTEFNFDPIIRSSQNYSAAKNASLEKILPLYETLFSDDFKEQTTAKSAANTSDPEAQKVIEFVKKCVDCLIFNETQSQMETIPNEVLPELPLIPPVPIATSKMPAALKDVCRKIFPNFTYTDQYASKFPYLKRDKTESKILWDSLAEGGVTPIIPNATVLPLLSLLKDRNRNGSSFKVWAINSLLVKSGGKILNDSTPTEDMSRSGNGYVENNTAINISTRKSYIATSIRGNLTETLATNSPNNNSTVKYGSDTGQNFSSISEFTTASNFEMKEITSSIQKDNSSIQGRENKKDSKKKDDSIRSESKEASPRQPQITKRAWDPLMPYPEEYPEEYQTIQNGPAFIITRDMYTRVPGITYQTVTMATLPTYEMLEKAEDGFMATLVAERKFGEDGNVGKSSPLPGKPQKKESDLKGDGKSELPTTMTTTTMTMTTTATTTTTTREKAEEKDVKDALIVDNFFNKEAAF